ncbi:MAG: histidine kinase [Eubacteriales bacterium]|nr:histidine kinase [Eubacteriales bacterium]
MSKWLARRTLFTRTFLLLMVVVNGFAFLTFSILSSAIEEIVSDQIRQQTRDTLNIANTKLQNQLMTGISVLVALRVNDPLLQSLQAPPTTAGERAVVANAVGNVISNAYYALESDLRVAVVSDFDNIYANWDMYDSASILAVRDEYLRRIAAAEAPADTLYSAVFSDVFLTQTGVSRDVYVQLMPLKKARNKQLCGVAMVMVPERDIYETLRFEQEDAHATYLTDRDGVIISARDKTLLGSNAQTVIGDATPERITQSLQTRRTQTTVIDVMSQGYVQRQVTPILTRMATYVLLVLAVVVAACFFITRGVTKPLVRLTKRMVSGNYAAFLQESQNDAGRNEVLLLERGFDVMGRDIEALLAENKRKEQQKRSTEIAALQAQIQPHFLFNTLNTARCSILNHHDEKAAELLYKLTMLLRMTLVKGGEMVPLSEELETVDYYLDIICMRHRVKLVCKKDIAPITEDFLVPKLLLQPVVENCVVHGMLLEQQDGEILIRTEVDDAFWYIFVENNGVLLDQEIDLRGSQAQKHDSFSGMGVKNVNQRLKLYYGEQSGLRLYCEQDRTVAQLTLSLTAPVDAEREKLDSLWGKENSL